MRVDTTPVVQNARMSVRITTEKTFTRNSLIPYHSFWTNPFVQTVSFFWTFGTYRQDAGHGRGFHKHHAVLYLSLTHYF